ncbi:hypothetical protein ABS71_00015 [bacterium SCN 62-11]|nr:MAG: hypothetical protein ABS71_00015 [bacterium SCN 62-11]
MRKLARSFALTLSLLACAAAQLPGILQPNTILYVGGTCVSPDGRFHLDLQKDGNVVLYRFNEKLWSAGTTGSSAARLCMQPDGNFVLYGDGGDPLWSSNTAGNPGAQLRVQNDGNMVIYGVNQRVLWATETARR